MESRANNAERSLISSKLNKVKPDDSDDVVSKDPDHHYQDDHDDDGDDDEVMESQPSNALSAAKLPNSAELIKVKPDDGAIQYFNYFGNPLVMMI